MFLKFFLVQDYYRYSSILFFNSFHSFIFYLCPWSMGSIFSPQIIPELSRHNYLKSLSCPQGFEMPPWFSAGLLCVVAYLLCQQITSDGWWSGVSVLRSSWSPLQGEKHFWRVLRNKHVWFSPPWTAVWFDLRKMGWACFRVIFQPSCPMMIGVRLCLLLLWITCPAPFLNICYIHPSSLFPSSTLDICSLQAFTIIAYFLRTCLNVCFSYLLLPNKSVQS